MKKLFLTLIALITLLGCDAIIVDPTPIATWDEVFLDEDIIGGPSYITIDDGNDNTHPPFIEYDKAKNIVGSKRGLATNVFECGNARLAGLYKYNSFISVEVGADIPAQIKKEDFIEYYDGKDNFEYRINVYSLISMDNPHDLQIGSEVAKIYIWADTKHTDLVTVYSFRL